MPVRSVMQVLFSEHGKLNRLAELSNSFSSQRSPNPALELPGRCPSKREVLAQHQEVRRLREDVVRLQVSSSSPHEVRFSAPIGCTDTETYVAGAVQRAAGPGGQAELREAATRGRRRWRLLQVERVLVRRWHGRRCCEGGQLGERHGTPDAAQGEEEQHRHGDAKRKVAQVNVLRWGC